ncbi:neutral zinc metallopeptidase [Nocardia violaceofusca]|uniref:neutral zinc metallopeptidase n=1 Tax=Nocardia violaceofusca TaxID=941182 RepID=UPI000A077EE7|nr:neutral zinc metallopeptidase [Nocardia violaceofusca]
MPQATARSTPGPTAVAGNRPHTGTGPVKSDPELGGNPVLSEQGVGLSSVDCRLPGWRNTPDGAEAYYRAAIGCHDAAWAPTLAHFRIAMSSPALWAGARIGDYDGACSSTGSNREAFYCAADRTIVMPFDTMTPVIGYGVGNVLAVLSHEYEHHVQQLTGIMAAFQARASALNWSGPEVDLLNRRLELQAWCFSGMFYGVNTGRGSITRSLADRAYTNNAGAGDRPGERRWHGTNQNVANWFGWGMHPSSDPASAAEPSLYECNPWAARSDAWLE